MNKILQILKTTVRNYHQDEIVIRSAGISYYAVFSIPAATILILSIIGIYLDSQSAQRELLNFIGSIFSTDIQNIAAEIIPTIIKYSPRSIGSIASIILLTVSASALFTHLIKTLNKIFGTPRKAKKHAIITFILRRLFSFLFIIFIVALLFTSLIADTALTHTIEYIQNFIPFEIYAIQLTNLIMSFILTTALFTSIFKFLPSKKIQWKESFIGGISSSLLFMIGRYILLYFLNNFINFSTFGAASTLVLLLIWIFYSSQTIFIGAEIIKSYSQKS